MVGKYILYNFIVFMKMITIHISRRNEMTRIKDLMAIIVKIIVVESSFKIL